MPTTAEIDEFVTRALAAIEEPASDDPPPASTPFRARFYELMVLSLGNLFPKMPNSGPLFDRTTINRVVMGLDDGDAAMIGKRTDDWMRLEGIIKQEEGKRAYFLPLSTQAALSVNTAGGLLGDVCGDILKRYATSNPSANLREATRALGAVMIQLLAK